MGSTVSKTHGIGIENEEKTDNDIADNKQK